MDAILPPPESKPPAFAVETWKPCGPASSVVMLVVRRANPERTSARRLDGHEPYEPSARETINVERLSGPMIDTKAMGVQYANVGRIPVPDILNEMFEDWLVERNGPSFPAPTDMAAFNKEFIVGVQRYAKAYDEVAYTTMPMLASEAPRIVVEQDNDLSSEIYDILSSSNRLWKSVCTVGGDLDATVSQIIEEKRQKWLAQSQDQQAVGQYLPETTLEQGDSLSL